MITLTGAPVLHTARLTLRVPAMRDWEAFAAFLTSDRASYVGGPVTRERAWRAFGHLVGHWALRGYGMFAVAQKGVDAAVGMAGPWFPESWPEQEIAWSIWAPEAEGEGLVRSRRHRPRAPMPLARSAGPLVSATLTLIMRAPSRSPAALARCLNPARRIPATTRC